MALWAAEDVDLKTKDYIQGKALITKGCEVDRTQLARSDVALKELG